MCEDTCQFKHTSQLYVLFFGCNKLLTYLPCSYRERNVHYAELCKNRMGNDKYVIRSMQTFNGAPKTKQIQSDKIVMVDEGWAQLCSLCAVFGNVYFISSSRLVQIHHQE